MKIKYTNENILKQVKTNSTFLKGIIVMIIVAVLLIISGPIITCIQRKNQAPLPDDPKSGFVIYYAELTEIPEELGNGYYAADIDGHKIILSMEYDIYRNIHSQLRNNSSASIHGTFSYIAGDNNNDEKETSRKIFESYYSPGTIEEHGYYYFNCINGGLLYESLKTHPTGLVFGITIFILVAMMCCWGGNLNMIKHLHPACGETKYTQEEIDAQANLPESQWIAGLGIYLAPEIMIGTQKGVTAVKYEEIARIRVKSKYHTMDKSDYYTYRLVVRTTNGKKLIFSDSRHEDPKGYYYDMIYKKCLEHDPNIIIEEPEKQGGAL